MPSVITYKTELALTTSPLGLLANQVFTDVSAFVHEATQTGVKRGRDNENSDIQPSTLSITFDNTDGRFTPGNPLSPYVATLDLGCVIRRTVTVDGTPYVRFLGYIDDIEVPEWVNTPFEKLANMSASDRLGRIGAQRAGTMLSMVDYESLALNPGLYWPLTEGSGATQGNAVTATETDPLIIVPGNGSATFGAGSTLPTDTATGVKFEAIVSDTGALIQFNTYLRAVPRATYNYGGTNKLSMSAWFHADSIWTSGTNAQVVRLDNSDFALTVYIDTATRKISAKLSDLPITVSALATGPLCAAGKTHCVAVVAEQGQPLKLYVDNVLYSGTTCPTLTRVGARLSVGNPFAGTIGTVGLYRSALTAANVTKIYSAAMVGTENMRCDAAMTLVAGYAGIPASEIVCSPPAQSFVANIPLHGRSRAEVLQQIAKIEGGILFVDGQGVMQFHTRPKRWGAGAPVLTFPTGDLTGSLAVSFNDQFLINEAEVTRTGGGSARAVDAASQTKRGLYSEPPIDLAFANDNELAPRARYRVACYKDLKPRLGALPVRVITSLAAQALLGVDIGSLVAISGLSPDAPSIASQWIEGIDESQGIDDYTITFQTSPVLGPQTVNFFRVGSGSFSHVGLNAPVAP